MKSEMLRSHVSERDPCNSRWVPMSSALVGWQRTAGCVSAFQVSIPGQQAEVGTEPCRNIFSTTANASCSVWGTCSPPEPTFPSQLWRPCAYKYDKTVGASEGSPGVVQTASPTCFFVGLSLTSDLSALRMVLTKPPDARAKFSLFVRYTFHTQASLVPPRNVSAVEHLLRRGKRQVELYENPSIKDCHISQAMKDWEQCHSKRYKISTPS